jgi:hypothetical protein
MDGWMDETMMRLAILKNILSRVSVDGMHDFFFRVFVFFFFQNFLVAYRKFWNFFQNY